MSYYAESSGSVSDNRKWEDTIVTEALSGKTIYCHWNVILYLYISGDVDTTVSKVACLSGGRVRKIYNNPTSTTKIECYNGTVDIYGKLSPKTWAYKKDNSGTGIPDIGSGLGVRVAGSASIPAYSSGVLPVRNRISDTDRYRVLFHNDSTDPYNASGWIMDYVRALVPGNLSMLNSEPGPIYVPPT